MVDASNGGEHVMELKSLALVDANELGCPSTSANDHTVRRFVVNQDPKIAVVPRFLSPAECAHLLDLASGNWAPAVASRDTGVATVPGVAACCQLRQAQTGPVANIEVRMSQVAGHPLECLQSLVVVQHAPAADSLVEAPAASLQSAGQVVCAYLSEPTEGGGELVFPDLGFGFTAREGAAVLWTRSGAAESLAQQHLAPAGLTATFSVYGLFADRDVRSASLQSEVLQERHVIDVRTLGGGSVGGDAGVGAATSDAQMKSFVLSQEPKISTVPRLLSEEDVQKLLQEGVVEGSSAPAQALEDAPVVLRVLAPGSSLAVRGVEAKLAGMARRPVQHLGALRVVRLGVRKAAGAGGASGDRGVGTLACHVCLGEREELHLPALGFVLLLRRGDALLWANATTAGRGAASVEDMRATWQLLAADSDAALAVEASFHEQPLRPTHMHVSQEEVEELPALDVGATVEFPGCNFRVKAVVGHGSFGTVWSARRLAAGGGEAADGVEAVIKEQRGSSQAALLMVSSEARLLARICSPSVTGAEGGAEASGDVLSRLPAYIASEVRVLGLGCWCSRLAMTCVPGVPLDAYLLELRAHLEATPRAVPPAGGRETQSAFARGCTLSEAMLRQLGPVLEHIGKVALHRDVNSRNVLVSGDFEKPHFCLVDFGLAVESSAWSGPLGPRSWHRFEVGGDCRYWPVSAWYQFAAGPDELSMHSPLCNEYQRRLDLHALAILALQALDAAWMAPPPPEPAPEPAPAELAPAALEEEFAGQAEAVAAEAAAVKAQEARTEAETEAEAQLPDTLGALRWTWFRYWTDAHRFWSQLLAAFHSGSTESLVHCRNSFCLEGGGLGVHNVTGHHLAALRGALAARRDAATTSASSEAAVRAILALLMPPELDSTAQPLDTASAWGAPEWCRVRRLLEHTDAA